LQHRSQHRGIQNKEHHIAVSNGCRTGVFSNELQLKVTGHSCSTEGYRTGNTTVVYQMIAEQGFQQRVAALGYRTWLQCRVAAQVAAQRYTGPGTLHGCIQKWLQDMDIQQFFCSSRLQDMVTSQDCSTDCSIEGCRTGNTTRLYQKMVAGHGYSAKSCSSRLQDMVAA
jgi:hypothetical protein